jgi:hypothetical protein
LLARKPYPGAIGVKRAKLSPGAKYLDKGRLKFKCKSAGDGLDWEQAKSLASCADTNHHLLSVKTIVVSVMILLANSFPHV